MMMTSQRTLLLLLAASLAAPACGKSGSSGKTATVELFGKTPVPPGDLAKVKAGMTQDDVKKLFPGIKPTPNHSGSPSLTIDSGYGNVSYEINFYSDLQTVADVTVVVPKDLGAQLEKAWGPPDSKGGMGPHWLNNDAGYEAEVWEMGRRSDVKFKPFTPLTAEYFGAKPGPFDVLTKVKLGMTRDEIAKAAPGFETAGAEKGNGSFQSYEGKPKDVRINIDYDQDNKAYSYIVELPPKGGDLVVKAWGARAGKARGTGSAMNCWDTADGMRIELDDNRMTFTTPDHSVCEVTP